jgi:hypothetical protein
LDNCEVPNKFQQVWAPDFVLLQTSSPYWTRDDIYIDDDGNLEGSGGGQREVKDDLESSGSGFGPDDEDADPGSGGESTF